MCAAALTEGQIPQNKTKQNKTLKISSGTQKSIKNVMINLSPSTL